MIDLAALRQHTNGMTAAIRRKNPAFDPTPLLAADDKRKQLQQQFNELRAKQNAANDAIAQASGEEKQARIAKMKAVAEQVRGVEAELKAAEHELRELLYAVPNPPLPQIPDGGEDDFRVVKTVGEVPQLGFEPLAHEALGAKLGIIDTERAAKVSGSRFYFLKAEAVLLQFALVQHALRAILAKGFVPMAAPTLVREEGMFATGFFPADRNEYYTANPSTPDQTGDDLVLAGTSEVPLTMYHSGEILELAQPLRYAGYSTCYRREAGSYGKDTKGIFRVHQFDKLEMYVHCQPEHSTQAHQQILAMEEEIIGSLGIPYRVVDIAAGDVGLPAVRKYDIEAWIPSQARYREVTSCSNCTDFQARRANIRYRTQDGKTAYAHTLNGTACAVTRMLIAILENNQQADGSVAVPHPLRELSGLEIIRPKSS